MADTAKAAPTSAVRINPPAVTKLTTRLLKDLGPNLPLGVGPPGQTLAKLIDTRSWRLKEERELGALRDQHKEDGGNMASFVAMVLGTMCTCLGNNLESLKAVERRAVIGQMWMGDVFYAYCWLRLRTMGSEVGFNMTCQACRTKFPFKADLNTLEVSCAASLKDAQWEYMLRDPFQARGRTVTGFLFGPARWNAMEVVRSNGSSNSGIAKSTVITGSIHGVLGDGFDGVMLTGAEMDELTKFDVERITAKMDDNSIGPNLALDDKCPSCHRQFRVSMDWNYDSFFSNSSP